MKKLEFCKAPVISYLHHAYPLGVVCQHPGAEKWIVANYIYMYWLHDGSMMNMLAAYNDHPYMRTRTISKVELAEIEKVLKLPVLLMNLIDLDIYIEVVNDDYYLPTSKTYQKQHHMHQLLINGYDEKAGIFYCWTFVNGIYQEATCKFDEVVPFQEEILYKFNTALLLFNKRDNGFTLDTETIWLHLEDYLNCKHPNSQIGIWGNFDQYVDADFGISCYQHLIDKLKKEADLDYIDYRFLNVLYEHKKCMVNRFEYIEVNHMGREFFLNAECINEFNTIMNLSEMCLKNSLKYNYISDRKKKDDKLERVVSIVEDIRDREIKLLSGMLYNKQNVVKQLIT